MDPITLSLTMGLLLGVVLGGLAMWAVMRANEMRAREDGYEQGWVDGESAANLDMLRHNVRPAWMSAPDRKPTMPNLVAVRRATTEQNGVRVEKSHLLPPDVARRL